MITLNVRPQDPRLQELQDIKDAISHGEDFELDADSMLFARVQLAVVKGEIPPETLRIVAHLKDGPYNLNMLPEGRAEFWPHGLLSEDTEVFRQVCLERRKRFPHKF